MRLKGFLQSGFFPYTTFLMICFFGRLSDMENTHNKCLQALKRSGAEKIFEAYNWLQEHRDEFNKEVYGPVLLEVPSSKFRQLCLCINFPFHLHFNNFMFRLMCQIGFMQTI